MEQSVSSCNQTIRIIKKKIEDSYIQLHDLQMPRGGDFALFRQMQLLKKRAQDEIGFNKHNLGLAENALVKAMQQLKTANIEHEKFKYLETTEIEKIIKARKLQESKELDEVAVMMFNKNKKS